MRLMRPPTRWLSLLTAPALVLLFLHLREARPVLAGLPGVTLLRTPDGGIQPQAAVDGNGTLHLIYFKGDPAAGDVFYLRREPGSGRFSAPVRVNSVPGSVIAVGSVRGAQLAIGKNGRVHVAWLGSSKAAPRGPGNASPMIYTRMNDAGTGFEPQRNVLQFATGLDGGGSVAADPRGNVYVVWHANPAADGEPHRRVWVARSTDNGKTFSQETPAYSEPTGACGCCGMRALAGRDGSVYILYRAATESVHRDMFLLTSRDGGLDFAGTRVAPWKINACPMSTASLSQSAGGTPKVLAAWETAGQVFYDQVDPANFTISPPVAAPGAAGDRKHPAVAGDASGRILLAWTEGTAWQKGGSLAWQLFDANGRPIGQMGRADGVPVWGLVADFANPGGSFTVVY